MTWSAPPLLPTRDAPIEWPNPLSVPGLDSYCRVHLGRGKRKLEVLDVACTHAPLAADVRSLWSIRWNRRAEPVLVVVTYPAGDGGSNATVCGPIGPNPSVISGMDRSLAARIAESALQEPTHHAAIRYLTLTLERVRQGVPGMRNEGLFATNELENGIPGSASWAQACARAEDWLDLRGRTLVESLGFRVEPFELGTTVLRAARSGQVAGEPPAAANTAVAIFCNEDETFEARSARFDTSPVSHAIAVAHRSRIRWVILTRAGEIRLYAAEPGTGVGGRGPTETYIELNLALLPSRMAGYLELLFSARALADGGSVDSSLELSERFSSELAGRLRERIYSEAVPALAAALARRAGPDPGREELDELFAQVMVIIFRILFVDYAEDRDLLPYRTNSEYESHSLTGIARRLVEDARNAKNDYGSSHDLWIDVTQIWRAVAEGNSDWGVPAYDGGLYSADPERSPFGAALEEISLSNSEFAPALRSILVDKGPEGFGLVDFRSLSAREFGTIYEGLLESNLSVAPQDLCLQTRGKNAGMYRPARGEGDEVVVSKGQVYLQNRLGIRKSTGTYFTKPFAVKHILDHSLDRALDEHVERLESLRRAGDEAGLAASFFDFRCADIAMGSGHFLVAAIDRIEARFSAYLAEHPVAAIANELGRIDSAARSALGPSSASVEIETAALLRRQIARHCVYGVDVNPIAVELARVAVWVHTFVPGLPLSFLDHNFVCGNSLTGVSALAEVETAMAGTDSSQAGESIFAANARRHIKAGEEHLRRLALTSDATRAEVEEALSAHRNAVAAVKPARDLFDLITAHRAGACPLPPMPDEAEIAEIWKRPGTQEVLRQFRPIHFPAVFPEVFLRPERSGFDCLIGNPPWDKLVVNREIWWGRHLPGVRSLPTGEKRAQIAELTSSRPDLGAAYASDREGTEVYKKLVRAAFNLGAGDTDLYKAFAWANVGLARSGGQIGLILPRSAISDAGMAGWRNALLETQNTPPRKGLPHSRWRPSSITGDGCFQGCTTPTRSPCLGSPDPVGRNVPQHGAMGFRRGRWPVHGRVRQRLQTQSTIRTKGVGLTARSRGLISIRARQAPRRVSAN